MAPQRKPEIPDGDPDVQGRATRRILLCIASMKGGGAERNFVYLCNGMVKDGWDVTVALLELGPNADQLRATGAHIHLIPRTGNYDPRILTRLAALILRLRPCIVYSWLPLMDIVAGVATKLSPTIFVSCEQNSALAYPSGWKTLLREMVMRTRCDAIIANSVAGLEYVRLRVRPRPDVSLHVIPTGLPFQQIGAVPSLPRDTLGLTPEHEVILFAGRFTAQKNLESFFGALPGVFERRPRAVAMACGDGPSRTRWAEWTRGSGLADRILLPGYVENIHAWLKMANVFVLPSLFEGRPNIVLEAIACGCPLVVSDIPPHREFLDESIALLARPDDPHAISDAIVEALADRDAALRRAHRARAILSDHSVDMLVRRHEAVFSSLLGRTAGGTSQL